MIEPVSRTEALTVVAAWSVGPLAIAWTIGWLAQWASKRARLAIALVGMALIVLAWYWILWVPIAIRDSDGMELVVPAFLVIPAAYLVTTLNNEARAAARTFAALGIACFAIVVVARASMWITLEHALMPGTVFANVPLIAALIRVASRRQQA